MFTPLDGWGHINACHGLAQELQSRGHRVVFAIDRAFKGKLTPFGFEEETHGVESADGKEYWPQFMEKYCHVLLETPLDIAEKFFVAGASKMFNDNKERDKQYQDIIDRVKPDVIIIDNYICSPTLTNQPGVPWIWLFSAAPHSALMDDRIPPPWSGQSGKFLTTLTNSLYSFTFFHPSPSPCLCEMHRRFSLWKIKIPTNL